MPCAPWQLRRSFNFAYYFAYYCIDLGSVRETQANQQKNTTKTTKTNKNQTNTKTTPPKKFEIDAGETVKRNELAPLNASLRCSPQRCSPTSNCLSHIPKHVCIHGVISGWHSLFRLLWILQLIDPIFRLPFLPSTGSRWICCNLSLLNSEVSTIFSKGIFHGNSDSGNLCIDELPHIFTMAKPLQMGRRIPLCLWRRILDIVITSRIDKESVINFRIGMYTWPISVHVWTQEPPIWFQWEPHMPGPCKLAVQVEGICLNRTHLHPANVEAFWPTMGHAINLFRPLTQTTPPREEDSNLSFLRTAPKPRTSCFLFERSSKDSFLESGELLQDIIHRKVKPINLELANERGEILFFIHGTKVKVQLSTPDSILSLGDQSCSIRSQCRSTKPQHVLTTILYLSSMQFTQYNWWPMSREPNI